MFVVFDVFLLAGDLVSFQLLLLAMECFLL